MVSLIKLSSFCGIRRLTFFSDTYFYVLSTLVWGPRAGNLGPLVLESAPPLGTLNLFWIPFGLVTLSVFLEISITFVRTVGFGRSADLGTREVF